MFSALNEQIVSKQFSKKPVELQIVVTYSGPDPTVQSLYNFEKNNWGNVDKCRHRNKGRQKPEYLSVMQVSAKFHEESGLTLKAGVFFWKCISL